MSEISLIPDALTMTSREIAELVEARHDKVAQSVERLVERGVFDKPPMGEYLDSLGRGGQKEYILDKRSSMIVVAQMSPEFTARMYDRWQELEAKVKAQEDLGINPELLKELIEGAANAAVEQARRLREVSFDMLREDVVILDDFCRLHSCSPERITDMSVELLKAYGKHDLAEIVQRLGISPAYDQHCTWKAVDDLAKGYADEIVKARRTLGKKPIPELTPEQAQSVSDNWRVKFLPYSLVSDPIFTTHLEPQERAALTPAKKFAKDHVNLALQRSTGKTTATWNGSSSVKRILAGAKGKVLR